MLDKIKPSYSSKNICIENLYISICNMLSKNSKNIYANSWNFGYVPNEEIFSKKITASRDGQLINTEQQYALKDYCGIELTAHANCNMKNFKNIVKRELELGKPVAIATDVYFCYWHLFSDKFHFTHYTLIVGIEEDGFVCVDDSLASFDGYLKLSSRPDHVKVSFETFEKYNFGFITFELSDEKSEISVDKIIYLSALKTLTGFNSISDFKKMRDLVRDIESHFDIGYEIGEKDDERAKALPRTFSILSWSRSNYFDFLSDAQKNCNLGIDFILDEMKKSKLLWEEINNYILKFATTRDFDKFNKTLLCNHLNKIISIEENLANYIVDKYEGKLYG